MRRFIISWIAIGLALTTLSASLAATSPSPAASASQPQADLAWFVVGLRDLGKSRDTRLRLLPAQAKKILPVLEKLAADRILVTEVTERQPNGQAFGGQGGALTEKQRQEMQARQKKMAERIEQAIDSMDGMLRQSQSDYIMNLDFDPAVYGLDRMRISQGLGQQQGQQPSQAEIQKMMKARQEARQRLVKLNREVLDMLRKLAAGK